MPTELINRPAEPPALRFTVDRVDVVGGPSRGTGHELKHHCLVVGAAPECDLVLDDSAVSRRHLELSPAPSGCQIRDLDSKNGVFVNGLRVQRATLQGDELIEIGQSRLKYRRLADSEELPLSSSERFGSLIGTSPAMRIVFALLERVSQRDIVVLLEGESGTGKDLVAENIHRMSPRAARPFVVVDCGTVAESLIESELFGHQKGAFTGADQQRAGAIEAARGGTVFLDEVGELALHLQPRLLRLLEKKEAKRVGENRYRTMDVRIVAATNRDLKQEVERGRFRQDLYYRLSVMRIRLPALRERLEDVSLLAQHFLSQRAAGTSFEAAIDQPLLALLRSHSWPGNVRELRNVIERLSLFPEHPELALDTAVQTNAAASLLNTAAPSMTYHQFRQTVLERDERRYLQSLLRASNGVVTEATRRADLPRQTFYRLLAKHGLR